MATRRPKVPRAAAAAPASQPAGRAETDGADVIRADFGGTRPGTAPGAGPHPTSQPKSQPNSASDGGNRTPAGAAPGAARTAAARAAAAKAGRSADSAAAEDSDPVPAKAFSGRMLALGLVMIAITILLAPSVKIFLEKRAEIAELEADISAKQAKQTDLKRQVSRWQDPNYVKQQARDRINMVMPGETGYWVFGSDLPAGTSGAGTAPGTATDPANLPWVDSLWESIRRSATD
ncbi:septum formation initiator family protein [Arthrobacter sp. UKPF54-2]|uniref:FtsB family cell division protein n=1 Tax=Arthrobacter sp. UKPF54-2 TaxID=2600159 RepID=UPI0011B17A3E|nr:septum formation initiator family protein [Arthrobacter sp. UKPF54-2]QDY88976.1 septum formation initiator family protein [Arthrobacter sp. UKPF54-2]